VIPTLELHSYKYGLKEHVAKRFTENVVDWSEYLNRRVLSWKEIHFTVLKEKGRLQSITI
jgi:hypothetical protein